MICLEILNSILTSILTGLGIYLAYKYNKKNNMSPKIHNFYYEKIENLNELNLQDKMEFSSMINELNYHIQLIYKKDTKFVKDMDNKLDSIYKVTLDKNMNEFHKMKRIDNIANEIMGVIEKKFGL